VRRALLGLLLVGCAARNPLNDAQEDCERINEAAQRYFDRCQGTPSKAFPDCSKVWGYAVPPENVGKCIAGLDATACGELTTWPEPCPRTWVYLPGL